jgi:hypothetical protein
MFKKTQQTDERLKAVVIDEFDILVHADKDEAERMYRRLLEEGKLLIVCYRMLIHL